MEILEEEFDTENQITVYNEEVIEVEISDRAINSQQSEEPWPYEPEIVDRIDAIDRRANDYINKGTTKRLPESKYVEEEDEEEYLSEED